MLLQHTSFTIFEYSGRLRHERKSWEEGRRKLGEEGRKKLGEEGRKKLGEEGRGVGRTDDKK